MFFVQAIVGVKAGKPTQLTAFREIVVLPMGWQQVKTGTE